MYKLDPKKVKYYRFVEIDPRTLGASGLNFAPYKVSSPRLHMLASHMGQKPAIIHGQPPLIYTGAERAYGEYLHTIVTPSRIIIREIINKYSTLTPDGQNPPLTIVIFEREDTGVIDALEVPHNYCNHQTFGFRYIRTPVMENLYPNQVLEEGTILAKPTTLNNQGDWCYGRNVRMGFIPAEAGIEDGLCISKSTAEKFALYGYGTVEMKFGKNKILLNTYGDENVYKPFPSIGDYILPSGAIMFAREFDPDLAPANMTKAALLKPNQTDDPVYGVPYAKVVDIRIIRSSTQSNNLPKEIDDYISQFTEKDISYHNSILKLDNSFQKLYNKKAYPLGEFWWSLVNKARFATNTKSPIKKETYRGAPLDDVQIIIQYEYIYIPNKGAKFTGRQGDKAVVTRIKEDHLMPRDSKGRYLDAYMDDSSTSNRMNGVRMDEITINSCMETAVEEIRVAYEEEGDPDKAIELLKEAVSFISPYTVDAIEELSREELIEDIELILRKDYEVFDGDVAGIRLLCPPNNPVDYLRAIPALNARFPALKDYLWITNDDGTVVQTKYPTITGMFYMIPLERQATKFAATSSAKRQHHAIPVKPAKAARVSSPINDSPTRDKGEDETRAWSAYNGGILMAEEYDRNLNPHSHQQVCRSIFASENPARILNCVPRNESQLDPTVKNQRIIPISGGRGVEIRDHVLQCGGVVFGEGEDGDSV